MALMDHCTLLHGELVNILCSLSFCTACHIVEEFCVIFSLINSTQLTTNLKQLNEMLQCTVKPSGGNNKVIQQHPTVCETDSVDTACFF